MLDTSINHETPPLIPERQELGEAESGHELESIEKSLITAEEVKCEAMLQLIAKTVELIFNSIQELSKKVERLNLEISKPSGGNDRKENERSPKEGEMTRNIEGNKLKISPQNLVLQRSKICLTISKFRGTTPNWLATVQIKSHLSALLGINPRLIDLIYYENLSLPYQPMRALLNFKTE